MHHIDDMDLDIKKFLLAEIEDIKSRLDRFGMGLNMYKKVELSTIDVCKVIGHFKGEAWLADDIQARGAIQAN